MCIRDSIKTTRAQTGIVFLAYNDNDDVNTIIENWKKDHKPTYDFTAEDGIKHTLWVVDEYPKVASITRIFDEQIPATYIADGHHRAASAAKVAHEMAENGLSISCLLYTSRCV